MLFHKRQNIGLLLRHFYGLCLLDFDRYFILHFRVLVNVRWSSFGVTFHRTNAKNIDQHSEILEKFSKSNLNFFQKNQPFMKFQYFRRNRRLRRKQTLPSLYFHRFAGKDVRFLSFLRLAPSTHLLHDIIILFDWRVNGAPLPPFFDSDRWQRFSLHHWSTLSASSGSVSHFPESFTASRHIDGVLQKFHGN